MKFNLKGKNLFAEKAAEQIAADMVVNVVEETKAAIRVLVVRSIREGIAPMEIARMMRSLLGMNSLQMQGALNYRKTLIKLGHPPEKVQKLLEKYTAKKIKQRTETIARTEVMTALNRGKLAGWLQAQEKGLLDPWATKKWLTPFDERTCPICGAVNGQEVLLNKSFQLRASERMMPPAHPRCRCTAVVNPDGLKRLK